MGKKIDNIAPTDLTSTYSKSYFEPGDLYDATGTTYGNGRWVWGVYLQSAVTASVNVPCVQLPSTTNQGIFTADVSDAYDPETRQSIVFPAVTAVSAKYMWFKCQGFHIIKKNSASTLFAAYDPFRVTGDRTLSVCTTASMDSGYFLEASTAGTVDVDMKVWLHGRRYT